MTAEVGVRPATKLAEALIARVQKAHPTWPRAMCVAAAWGLAEYGTEDAGWWYQIAATAGVQPPSWRKERNDVRHLLRTLADDQATGRDPFAGIQGHTGLNRAGTRKSKALPVAPKPRHDA